MNKLLPAGRKVLANIIAGKADKINGMYILYGSKDMTAAPDVSMQYLDTMIESGSGGFARIPITGAQVDDSGNITFTALLTAEDTEGCAIGASSKVLAAVLTWMPDDNRVNDVFVYSSVMKHPVQLVKGAYMTINVRMVIGE